LQLRLGCRLAVYLKMTPKNTDLIIDNCRSDPPNDCYLHHHNRAPFTVGVKVRLPHRRAGATNSAPDDTRTFLRGQ